MQDDFLKNLIREADARPQAAGGNPAELAVGVRALYLRRRRRRLAATAAALVLAGCLLWWIVPQGRVPPRQQPSPEVAIATRIEPVQPEPTWRATIEQIDGEERIVQRLLLAERARRLAGEAREISGRMTVPASRDELVGPVAAGYLVSGDHKRAAGLPTASARNDYARVVELFPGTTWADQAKARLASLKP
jgi:hypothetical protein